MMSGAPVNQRVRSAGIVAQHAADATAVAGRSFRAEKKSVRLKGKVEFITHHSWLNPGPSLSSINLKNPVPMPGNIANDAASHHLAAD